jgi:hypothetical protein
MRGARSGYRNRRISARIAASAYFAFRGDCRKCNPRGAGRVDDAWREVEAGVAATEAEATGPAPFRAVGLYLLKGPLCVRRGATAEGLAAWERELALSSRGHLYGRECCTNAWYAKRGLSTDLW